MTNNQKAQLGKLLIEKQILSQVRFDDALRAVEVSGKKLEEHLGPLCGYLGLLLPGSIPQSGRLRSAVSEV